MFILSLKEFIFIRDDFFIVKLGNFKLYHEWDSILDQYYYIMNEDLGYYFDSYFPFFEYNIAKIN